MLFAAKNHLFALILPKICHNISVRRIFFNIYIDQVDENFDMASIKPGSHIVSLNLEMLISAKNSYFFADLVRNSDLIFADGAAISLISRYFFAYKDIKKIAGIDFAKKLLDSKNKIAFLGSSEENISSLEEKLRKKYSNKEFFFQNGFFPRHQPKNLDDFSLEEEKIIQEIKNFDPEIIFFALGSPEQEELIFKYKKFYPNAIMMGVGGSFDIWSGRLKRAPKWMINLNLEWFFRIIQEPYRFFRFISNVSQCVVLLVSSLFDERY